MSVGEGSTCPALRVGLCDCTSSRAIITSELLERIHFQMSRVVVSFIVSSLSGLSHADNLRICSEVVVVTSRERENSVWSSPALSSWVDGYILTQLLDCVTPV